MNSKNIHTNILIFITISLILSCEDTVNVGDAENHSPTIDTVSISVQNVAAGGYSKLVCNVNDPDGDILKFTWTASAGSFSDQCQVVKWFAPDSVVQANIKVVVSDNHNGKDSAVIVLSSHFNAVSRILVDASHDGGAWWFPQSDTTGFSETNPHQGKAIADYLRSRGYIVDELPRGFKLTDSLFNQYDKVIRTGWWGVYSEEELAAYDALLSRSTSLIFISEYLRSGWKDYLAEKIGLNLRGIAYGSVTQFAPHEITNGANPFYFNAGSVVVDYENNPSIEILGWLSNDSYADFNDNGIQDPDEPSGPPVMGTLFYSKTKIFFLGEVNGLESLPQPLFSNLVDWAFE